MPATAISGYVAEATQRAGIEGQMAQAANKSREANPVLGSTTGTRMQMVARDMEHIVENSYVIIGSPDEVTEQLRQVAKDLNVGHLMLLLQFGNLNKERTRTNTRLFAEKVLPNMRDLFSEWDDRWWPKPVDASARAAVPAVAPEAIAAE